MRFKQAAGSVHAFNHVSLHSTLPEGREKIDLEGPFDIIFVSERFSETELKDFLEAIRDHKHSQDAAFVLLLGAGQDLKAKTAEAILRGFHGCLMEPYSVDALVEIARLTTEVKSQRKDGREKAAIKTLVRTLIHQVDRMAYIQFCKMDPGQTLKNFKDACRTVAGFDSARLEAYLEGAVDLFEKTRPDETLGKRRRYKGVSRRVKKKVVKHLLKQEEDEHRKFKKIKF